jgi:hypothetical protein
MDMMGHCLHTSSFVDLFLGSHPNLQEAYTFEFSHAHAIFAPLRAATTPRT